MQRPHENHMDVMVRILVSMCSIARGHQGGGWEHGWVRGLG